MKEYLFYLIILILLIIIYIKNNSKELFDNLYNNSSYELPPILWSYWDNIDTMPKNVINIINKRKKKLKNWHHVILSTDTLYNFININDIPKNFDTLIPAHKADWIRLYLLNKYGGIWIDASIIVNNPMVFKSMYNYTIKKDAKLTAFYLGDDQYSFIENWFIIAPKNSYIIKKWLNEFEDAINIGFMNYKNKIINMGINVLHIYIWGSEDTYLTMHAGLQKLIQRNEIDKSDILLYDACETMFNIHCNCNWDNECIKDKLNNSIEIKNIPFIKLRSHDRNLLNEFY